jgi:hypothetical protein
MTDAVCAKCGLPSVTVHLLNLDQGRKTWLICCLCMGELVSMLDAKLVTGS